MRRAGTKCRYYLSLHLATVIIFIWVIIVPLRLSESTSSIRRFLERETQFHAYVKSVLGLFESANLFFRIVYQSVIGTGNLHHQWRYTKTLREKRSIHEPMHISWRNNFQIRYSITINQAGLFPFGESGHLVSLWTKYTVSAALAATTPMDEFA